MDRVGVRPLHPPVALEKVPPAELPEGPGPPRTELHVDRETPAGVDDRDLHLLADARQNPTDAAGETGHVRDRPAYLDRPVEDDSQRRLGLLRPAFAAAAVVGPPPLGDLD